MEKVADSLAQALDSILGSQIHSRYNRYYPECILDLDFFMFYSVPTEVGFFGCCKLSFVPFEKQVKLGFTSYQRIARRIWTKLVLKYTLSQ